MGGGGGCWGDRRVGGGHRPNNIGNVQNITEFNVFFLKYGGVGGGREREIQLLYYPIREIKRG